MTHMEPYSGSLLRLAFTTTAILALAAVAISAWQGSIAGVRLAPRLAPAAAFPGVSK